MYTSQTPKRVSNYVMRNSMAKVADAIYEDGYATIVDLDKAEMMKKPLETTQIIILTYKY